MSKKSDTDFKIAWAKYPFVRIMIPFLLGIITADFVPFHPVITIGLAGILLSSLFFLHFFSKQKDQGPYLFGIASFFFWMTFSYLWTSLHDERNLPYHFSQMSRIQLITRTYYLEEKDRFWDCYSHVIAQIDSNETRPTQGTVLIRIPKTFHLQPENRDVYQGVYTLRTPEGPSAPFEFDWNILLHRRNIHRIAYADTALFRIIEKSVPGRMERSRYRIDKAIQGMISNERDYPVASAMLIGLRKKMDPELYRAYSATGAVHVLSVSGMHVGMLAALLNLFFGLFKSRSDALRMIKAILIVALIWAYTFLTGATPSILRSALMFTCFILARNIERDAASMNILAGAALILLLINPRDIYNIGFQLSFGAMAGIFLLYQPIRQSITVTNKAIQYIWEITAVSFAAQFMIYPIVGYHFHQFAFYFWLTGWISALFSYGILIGGAIALPIYFLQIPWLKIFYYPLIYSVKWMNDMVAKVYTFPLGRVRGWWPSTFECTLLILVSIMIGIFLANKTHKTLKPVLFTLILFICVMTIDELRDQYRTEIVATNSRGNTRIWLKNKMSLIQLAGDTSLLNSNYVEKYNIRPEHILRPDTSHSVVKNYPLEVSAFSVCYNGIHYRWVKQKSDTVQDCFNERLICLSKYWQQPIKNKTIQPSTVYVTANTDHTYLKKLLPQSNFIQSKSSFIQLPL
jgi:competence protein ComEC